MTTRLEKNFCYTDFVKKKTRKVFAFIDATNIIYGADDHGWRMDYKKLADFLATRFGVEKILYYAGVDNQNLKQLNFYEKLQDFGYSLRLVPVKTFSDGKKKADVDSRMTFEMMLYLQSYEEVVVMTGDGDYYWVLEYLKQTKKRIVLLSFPSHTAKELKVLFAGDFMDLNDIKTNLEFKNKNATDPLKVSAARDYVKIVAKKKPFVK